MGHLENLERQRVMPEAASNLLILLTVIMAGTLIVANLLALKIWEFCAIPVDGGIWLFPLSYIAGDVLCEIYGRPKADRVAYLCTGAGVATVLLLHAVNALPSHYAADNSAYEGLVAASGKVMLASFVSFLAGQLLNNFIFEKIRQRHDAPQAYGVRSLGSSVVAHLVDALLFETIAFYGRLPLADFLNQVIFAFWAGLLIETAMLPSNIWLTNRLALRVSYRNGEYLPD